MLRNAYTGIMSKGLGGVQRAILAELALADSDEQGERDALLYETPDGTGLTTQGLLWRIAAVEPGTASYYPAASSYRRALAALRKAGLVSSGYVARGQRGAPAVWVLTEAGRDALPARQ